MGGSSGQVSPGARRERRPARERRGDHARRWGADRKNTVREPREKPPGPRQPARVASATPNTATAMPASDKALSVSPKKRWASSAATGGTR